MTAPPEDGAARPDIETVSTRLVYENPWIRVREDRIRRRDGSPGLYGVVERTDFVVVVAVEPDGSVHLVEQYRYPVRARSWEFVQGVWGGPGADPALAARAELREEAGLEAASLVHAGHLWVAAGIMNQGYHVFLATGLTPGPATLEREEQDLVSRRVARAEFEAMLRNGTIRDGVTHSAYALLRLNGLL